MIKRKSKALLCAIASIGFINSIEIIHANAYNNSFSDTKGHWAEAEISKFNDLGYISGYEINYYNVEPIICRYKKNGEISKNRIYTYPSYKIEKI